MKRPRRDSRRAAVNARFGPRRYTDCTIVVHEDLSGAIKLSQQPPLDPPPRISVAPYEAVR